MLYVYLSIRLIGYLHGGDYFSEYSCLLGEPRTATVVASTFCELYSLTRADLEQVLQQWPKLAAEFESLGETRHDRGQVQLRSSLDYECNSHQV